MKKEKSKLNQEKGATYGAKDIYVLEGLEPVRKRPGMYIGSTGIEGLHHLIWEVADNSLDEAMAGYAKNVSVALLPDNQIQVVDDGRGIPVEMHKQTKKSALETVMTTLHAGAKFGGESYKVAGGLHGVGVSVVNALSKKLRAEVCKDGAQWAQEYERGKPESKVKKIGKCEGSGTSVIFEPDPEIFKEIRFDWQVILDHLRQQAYLTKGIRILVQDKREKDSFSHKSYAFYFEGGIKSFVDYLNRDLESKHENLFYAEKEVNGINVEVSLRYVDDLQAREMSFANNIYTPEGGMHLTGFRTALTRILNDYARKNGFLKEGEDNLTGEDAKEGLTVVISIKLREPQFEGQTKAKLGNPEARSTVESVFAESFSAFLEEHPQDARAIIEKALIALKARKAAKAAKDLVLRKGVLEGLALPGKLTDCQTRHAEDAEIFIVEGDSGGGCFSGDTKIALTDGRNISFRDLVKESEVGRKHYCYTIRKDGRIGIEKIKNPRITKYSAKVMKVILDNGEEIICTPDHKFMLRDGSYRRAKDLTPHCSLMPLRRQLSRFGKRITIEGYEMFFDPAENRWLFTHMFADKHNLDRGAYRETDGAHRHHKDLNKLNNNPDNIVRLADNEHLELHRKLAKFFLHRPEAQAKATAAKRTSLYRERARQKALEKRDFFSQNAKKQWENEEYKKYMAQKFLEFCRNHPEYKQKNSLRLKRLQKEYWLSAINREKQAERVKKYFEEYPQEKQRLSDMAKRQWSNVNLLRWRAEKTKEQWTLVFREKRRLAYNQTYLRKALAALKNIHNRRGFIDENLYNKIRRETGDRSLIRLDTICRRFFENNSDKLQEAVLNYNHTVQAVVPLNELMDVYDIEVSETHNFALAAGVFAHNSAKQARDRRFQAILPLKGKILNIERARLDKMLASKEIKALIIALGAAIADDFDISKLRYHKVVIMTDADTDGAHIRTLLLTLFYRYYKPIIEAGYLYIAQPPLYRIRMGRDIKYSYSDKEKDKIISDFQKTKKVEIGAKAGVQPRAEEKEIPDEESAEEEIATQGIKGVVIHRYKGLGEMNPEQLWETTMDPERRIFKLVTIKDAEEANRTFDVLMGGDVAPRKSFIQTHAKAVQNLDV